MAYYVAYYDAYYRAEGVDTGVSYFNCGDAGNIAAISTNNVLPGGMTGTPTPEKFTGVASASSSGFGVDYCQRPVPTPTKKVQVNN